MPAVLWFHGLGMDKETHRKKLEQIARAGFLAGHGERSLPDLDERIDVSREASSAAESASADRRHPGLVSACSSAG